MATRVTLVSRPELTDRAIVEKAQLTNDLGDREAEARWLSDASHRGVVRLLEVSDDPFTIVTEHAGTTTLRTDHGTAVEAARRLTQVAETLADLHDRQLVHGKITLDHIILSESGPVLCSPDGTIAELRSDVAGLGRCIDDLLRRWHDHPDEAGRFDRALWEQTANAMRAADDENDLTACASMRRAIRLLERLGDGPALSPTSPTSTATHSPSAAQWRGRALVGLATVLVLTLGGAMFTEADPGAADERVGGALVDVFDEDGRGARYAVGQDGDGAVALDGPCWHEPVVFMLRRADATVWRFDGVADAVSGEVVARAPGATAIVKRLDDDGCAAAWVQGPAGATQVSE